MTPKLINRRKCNDTYFVGVRSYWDTKSPRQSKICEFNVSVGINEQVLWFEISMKDTMAVTVVQPLEQLIQIALEQSMRRRRIRIRIHLSLKMNDLRISCL